MADKANPRFLVNLSALFVLALVVVRAFIQSVTIDEAVSYLNFALPPSPTHWLANGVNHVLNSAVTRLFTSVFGVSHLAVRSGALLGALIYVTAVRRLCFLLCSESVVIWPLFACLTLNPFILDFLIAGRGYSLGLGLLAVTAAAAATLVLKPATASPFRHCAAASLAAGLSFAANYSFAIAAAAALLATVYWASASSAILASTSKSRLYQRAKLLAAAFIPGLLAAAYFTGYALRDSRQIATVAGTFSWKELFGSLAEASLYEPNPYILSPLAFKVAQGIGPAILVLLGVFCLTQIALLAFERTGGTARPGHRLRLFAATLLGIIGLTLLGHALLTQFTGIPLPKDRTGIFLVFFLTLLAGALAALPVVTTAGRASRAGLTAVILVLASYFLCCLRVNYFKEWKFNADTDKAYSALAYYQHTCGIQEVQVNWRFDAVLRFYRRLSRREPFREFTGSADYGPDRPAYVLYLPEDQQFVEKNRLAVAWSSPSGIAVVLNPAVESTRSCPTPLPRDGIRP